jgi:hypothetical protein
MSRKWKTEEFCTRCKQRIGVAELADQELLDERKVRAKALRGQAILHAEEISALAADLTEKNEALRAALWIIEALRKGEVTPADWMRLEELRAVARTR